MKRFLFTILVLLLFTRQFNFQRTGRHEEFPQWRLTGWIVSNTGDNITLNCADSLFYPFNDTKNLAIRMEWILPERAAYLHIVPGERIDGWSVSTADGSLLIEKSLLRVRSAADGMYVCAVLAKAGTGIYSWYYLRWGVGLYADVAAMNEGGISRYNRQFIVAMIAVLVYAALVTTLALTITLRYTDEFKSLTTESKVDLDSETSNSEHESEYIK